MKTFQAPWLEDKNDEWMCVECNYTWKYKPALSYCPFCEEDDTLGKIVQAPDEETMKQMFADKQLDRHEDR